MSLDAISNAKAITSVYDNPAILESARLHRLQLNESGSTVVMHIAIVSRPSKPPSRWSKEVNAAIIELQLTGLHSILLSKWTPEAPPTVAIIKAHDGLINIETSDNSLRITCELVYVLNLTGYVRTSDSPPHLN